MHLLSHHHSRRRRRRCPPHFRSKSIAGFVAYGLLLLVLSLEITGGGLVSAAPEISDFRSTWLSALWDWCFKTNRQDINSSSASLSSKTAFREEQFLDACMMGDIVLVKHFLQLDRPQSSEEEAVINDDEKPVNASVVTPQTKNSCLMFAAKAGKLELTRILLSMDHGVKSINLQDFPRGATALMHAIEQNHPSIVNLLIEREELDFEIRDLFRGQTALLIAAKYNRFEMFQMMVETGRVDVNAQDSKGRNSLLHSIAFERQPDIVADDQDAGETLTITTTQEEDSICMLLLNHYFEALHQHINDADVEIRETPLILAASKGLVHVVSRLIQLGASTGSRNVVGTTPLLAAVSRLDHSPQSSSYYSLDREKRMVAVIRILVGRIVFEAKEYVSSTNTTTTITPTTSPDAVEDIHKALCGLLYADQRKGITPLMTAAKKGNVEVVRLLVTAMRESLDEFLPRNNQHHLNDVQSVMSTWVDSREYDGGRTALILASMQYAGARSDVIKHLLEAGANPNAQDFFGSTALMWVVSSCNRPSVRTEVMDVLKLLIETGKADVNVVDDRGQTVLHIASKMKLGSIFQYLAEFKTIKPLEEEENECPICCEEFDETENPRVYAWLCPHALDKACVTKMKRLCAPMSTSPKCPMCRETLLNPRMEG